MKGFIEFCKSKKAFVIIIILVSLFSVAILYQSSEARWNMFVFSEDRVRGVKGESMKKGVSLSVTAVRDGVSVERNVILKRGTEEKSDKKDEYTLSPEDEINIEITRMIREMNRKSDEVLFLPDSIGDSMTLEWNRNESNFTWLLPLIFPPMLLVFMYRGEKDDIKQRQRREADLIVNELPSFNNKLVLLLGSGLVYEESLKRIAVKEDEEGIGGMLSRKLGEAIKDAESTNRDSTRLLNDFARTRKISELKRITNIIMDNREKGTDLRSKLSLEGEILWEKRKKRAEEQGRIAESKLTLPLGIMMIALLIITAGPALMQM